MKKILLIILLLTGLLLEAFSQEGAASSLTTAQAQNRDCSAVNQLFEKYSQEEGIHNAFFRMERADGVILDLVSGSFTNGEKVSLNTPYYSASIGKTFTATAIAQLVEAEALSYDDKVADHLDTLVKGLAVVEGVDYGHQLTIHHLLSHTSGLPDYFEDQPAAGVNMIQKLFLEPDRFWEPVELISFTKNHFQAHFQPGQGYHYTDTEYVLLGLIIEKVTGLPLHEYFEEHIFNPLTMELTSMNLRSEPAAKPDFPLAEIYVGPMEISRYQSLSADWAGGAIRSTGKDLKTFLKTLLQGALVSKEGLANMQQWIPESQGTYYGYGLRKWVLNELDATLPPFSLIGHSGSTGAFMYYCPELEVYLSGTFNNTDFLKEHIMFMVEVLMRFSQNAQQPQR